MVDKSHDCEEYSPVIGILSVDIAHKLRDYYGSQFTSYLAASYVKFIEGAGGKVVPIWIGRSRDYYERILSHLNGILLPGGAVYFNEENGYADAGKFIYEISTCLNNKGVYMPIFGICLGYELLLYASAGTELRQDCNSVGVSFALNFLEGADRSRLFGSASTKIKNLFSTEQITFNYHKYCITEDDLRDQKINNDWIILSTNSDTMVKNYISSVEHKKYPYYGVQFHPEKNKYEHKSNLVNHGENAIECSNYLAIFFVNEARKNNNRFDVNCQKNYLIANFNVITTDHSDVPWEECYLFQSNTDYPQH